MEKISLPKLGMFMDQLQECLKKTRSWKIILGLLLLPFGVLALFNHPSADDFCYVEMVDKMGLWPTQLHWYTHWSGRYTATFFQTFNPLACRSIIGYQLESLFLVGLLAFAVLVFFHRLVPSVNRSAAWPLTVAVLLLYFMNMPSLVQGLFWLSGALTYQLGNIGILFGWALLYPLSVNGKGKRWQFMLLGLVSVLTCGTNETVMVEWLYIFTGLLMLRFWQERKISAEFSIIWLLTVASAAVVIASPGNALRSSHFDTNHRIGFSIAYALLGSIEHFWKWLPLVLLVAMVLFPLLPPLTFSYKDQFRRWFWLYPFFILGLLFLGFFPAYWSLGGMPPLRTLNVVYLLFILSCLHFALMVRSSWTWPALPGYARLAAVFLFITLVFPKNNYRTACMDLLSGRAWVYDKEMQERYQKFESGKHAHVVVKPLTVQPASVFFVELDSEGGDWKNACTADYFHLSSIRVEPVSHE